MAEQLAFEEVFRDGGAVDGHEGLLVATAVVVDGAGDDLLAGAAFPRDEHGGVGVGDLPDELEHGLHGIGAADDAEVVVLLLELGREGDGLAHVAGGLEGIGHELLETRDVEGLQQVVERAQLHGLDGRLGGAIGGHEDDRELGVRLPDAAQRLQPVDPRHPHVRDHQVRPDLGHQAQSLLAAGGGVKLQSGRVKDAAEGVLNVRLVVDEQQLVHEVRPPRRRALPFKATRPRGQDCISEGTGSGGREAGGEGRGAGGYSVSSTRRTVGTPRTAGRRAMRATAFCSTACGASWSIRMTGTASPSWPSG